MQISLKWINELVNIESVNLNKLIQYLTLGGFEVEKSSEVQINNQKQIVLEISATANRSDSLSIYGISVEIATLLSYSLKIARYTLKNHKLNQILKDRVKVLSNTSKCYSFFSVVVENLKNQKSPKWMQEKLQSCGINPSNDLGDFQNYILLETGYPLEIYDIDKIKLKLQSPEFILSIEESKNTQKFFASNEIIYELDPSILTVQANKISISIAGIIGSKNFSVSQSTTNLLIEASIFSAGKIRQQSRKLGLRTERSARYEKSLSPFYLKEALFRLVYLLRIANPNLTLKLHQIQQIKEETSKPIALKYKTVKEILGPLNSSKQNNFEYIMQENIDNYLRRLNFNFIYDKSLLIWHVEIPKLRVEDITREIDLIEEIGRLHGFNNFLTTLPKIDRIGNEDSTYKIRKKITSCLLNLGLSEFINYSLVNKTTFIINEIDLINPLLADCSTLRKSLLPNLVKTVGENFRQKNLSIQGFEYGHVFCYDSKTKFSEKEQIAGIFGGVKTKLAWTNPEVSISWFEAKGKIEQLFTQLNLVNYWKPCLDIKAVNFLHPYRNADIYLTNEIKVGIFGQIHPLLANKFNLPPEIYLFEFSVEVIENQLQKNNLIFYKSYSIYPKIVKDLSFIIEKSITFEKIRKILHVNGTKFLSEVKLLDEYQGQSIPEQKKSLCLQLIFQSTTKTLENKEIEITIQNLQSILVQKFKADIRS